MERKEHLEFCKNCEHRKWTFQKGFICQLTSKIAEFDLSCANFSIDSKIELSKQNHIIYENEKREILKKYIERNQVISDTKIIVWDKYNNIEDLPDEFKFRKSNWRLINFGIIAFPFVMTFLIWFDDGWFSNYDLNMSVAIFIFSTITLIINYLPKKEQKTLFTIEKNGIILENDNQYSWSQIETFFLEIHKEKGKSEKFLIIKPYNQEDIQVSIYKIRYSSAKIGHLIELYKSVQS